MRLLRISEKNDPVMRAVKAVHSVTVASDSVAPEDLERQRTGQDLFSKLATPVLGTATQVFSIPAGFEAQVQSCYIPAEWVKPDFAHRTDRVILYCHGGGYTCGSLKYAGILASKLSLHTGLEVLSFEYRLAPEHPYPAAIEDGLTAWNYLMQYGYGAKDVIIAGDSAGGNLALEICLELKKQKRMLPKALILISPWTDMTVTSETYVTHREMDPMLTADYVKAVRGAYAGKEVDYSRPEYSPLFGDLRGFPTTLIQVGTHEVLLGDSTHLAERMKKQGVSVQLEICENGWHVFQQMPIRRANKAMKSIGDFVHGL